MTNNYKQGLEYFENTDCFEVYGIDFYRDIFPNNESSSEQSRNDYSRPNAIFLFKPADGADTLKRLWTRIMLDDMWEDDFNTYVKGNSMTLCSGVAYRGGSNTVANARQMNALVIDIDGVGSVELERFFDHYFLIGIGEMSLAMPHPTYTVLSGNGIHFYYVFKEPIALFPNIKKQMKTLKEALINLMWLFESTSQVEKRQYSGITQGFRMVGSTNNKYNTTVRAFKTGGRVSLEYLNEYVKPEHRVDIVQRFKKSTYKLDETRELFPEWYQKVIVDGNKTRKKWNIKRDLYEWWKRQVTNEAIVGGRRYNFMMCMCAYAIKCDIPIEELEADMDSIFKFLKNIPHNNELTESDKHSAFKAYHKKYYNMKIIEIEKKTGFKIERNKRNGQKQVDHLEEARAIRDIRMKRQGKKWTDNNGRPSAVATVKKYQKENPKGKKADCIRDTKLSKPTVYKWWNY